MPDLCVTGDGRPAVEGSEFCATCRREFRMLDDMENREAEARYAAETGTLAVQVEEYADYDGRNGPNGY